MANQPTLPATFRNDKAVGLRVGMLFFIAILGGFSYAFLRQEHGLSGLFTHHPYGLLIFLTLWVAFIGCLAYACLQPRIVVTVTADSILTREIWLWRSARDRRYKKTDAFVPPLEHTVDDEGGHNYACTMRLPDRFLTVAEGHHEESIKAVRARLLAALAAGNP